MRIHFVRISSFPFSLLLQCFLHCSETQHQHPLAVTYLRISRTVVNTYNRYSHVRTLLTSLQRQYLFWFKASFIIRKQYYHRYANIFIMHITYQCYILHCLQNARNTSVVNNQQWQKIIRVMGSTKFISEKN